MIMIIIFCAEMSLLFQWETDFFSIENKKSVIVRIWVILNCWKELMAVGPRKGI